MRHSTGLAFLLLIGVAAAARAQNPADSAAPAPAPGQPKAPAAPPSAPLIAAPLEDVAAPGAAPADSTARAAPAGGAAPPPPPLLPRGGPGSGRSRRAPAGVRAPLRDTTLVVDKVVAVVGNQPILASQVDEEIFARQSQGLKPPSSPAELAALRKAVDREHRGRAS